MKKEIYLNYPNASSGEIKVNFKVTQENNIHHIECAVDTADKVPNWLQSTRFNLTSMKKNNHCSLLFEEMKYNKNLDTILFMDRCFAKIMESLNLSYDH